MFRHDEYIHTSKLDWAQLIIDIYNCGGVNYSQISDLLGISWSSLTKIRQGVEPREHRARSIIILHYRMCGRDLTIQRFEEVGDSVSVEYFKSLFQ